MWFIICWISLGSLLIFQVLMHRSWITAQSAFSGVWFLSLSVLWAFPSAQEFISAKAALLIILAHLAFFLAGTLVYYSAKGRKTIRRSFLLNANANKAYVYISIILISIGSLGSWLAVESSGSFSAFQGGTLAMMRSMLSEQAMSVPTYVRLMSNFLYPACILGVICFLTLRRSLWSWMFVLFPIAGSILYGFAFGGRGAVIMTMLMMSWGLAIGGKKTHRVWTNRLLFILVIAIVLSYSIIIAETRQDSTRGLESVSWYFAGPIPAFSEWLTIRPVPLINTDFSNLAIVREIRRLFGSSPERSIGLDTVMVPFGFNVFTSLAEHVRDFGIIGMLVLWAFLGACASVLESRPQTASTLGVSALIYAYLSFSLFADMSFLIVGWWLSLLIIVGVFPLLNRFASIPKLHKIRMPIRNVRKGLSGCQRNS